MRQTILIFASFLVLAGCSGLRESRLNPGNWFGPSEPETAVETAPVAPIEIPPLIPADRTVETVDTRALIQSVDALTVARLDGGALIQASGTAARLGAFNADLVPVGVSNGTLSLAFRVAYPEQATEIGPVAARRVDVGLVLSDAELSGVRQIQVQGAEASRVVRR